MIVPSSTFLVKGGSVQSPLASDCFSGISVGKRHQTLFFQSQKEVACRVFFQLAVGLHPVPILAEFTGNVTPSSVKMLGNERLDRGDIVCVQLS